MLIQKTIHTAPLGRADYTDHQRKLPNGERRTLPFKAVEISPTVPSRRPSPNPLPKGEGVLRLGGGTDSAVVGRNKPASAGVSGNTTGQVPETVVARPYSGLPLWREIRLAPPVKASFDGRLTSVYQSFRLTG